MQYTTEILKEISWVFLDIPEKKQAVQPKLHRLEIYGYYSAWASAMIFAWLALGTSS